MDCKTCVKLIDDYTEESVSPDLKALIDRHLTSCGSCRGLLDGVKRLTASITDSLVRTTGFLKLRPDIEGNVLSAMEERREVFPLQDMMKLFEELSFFERLKKMMHGLRQPPETGEYKWARLQMLRLSAPAAGVIIPFLMLLIATIIVALEPKHGPAVQVTIKEEVVKDELKEVEPPPDITPPEPSEVTPINDVFIPSTAKETAVGPDVDFSPQPALFDAVAIIKSPVVMKGIYGNRNPGARGSALGRYGGSGAGEGAVLRALRWMKKYQEEDGSWTGTSGNSPDDGSHKAYPNGMTGLALLCYLAHGETPASPEFGKTVDKAIRWLIANQAESGRWKNTDRGYCDAICGYALAETYAMTKNSEAKRAAEKMIDVLIKGQHPNGGMDYNFIQSSRDDTSMMAWSAQAFKAAKMAGLSNSGLDAAMKNAVNGFKKNYNPSGYWGYTCPTDNNSTARGSLTGAGALCMQLLGAGNDPDVKAAVSWMDQNVTFDWQNPWGSAAPYCWYYVTQAMFHSGGQSWKNWNQKFSKPLVANQIVLKGAGVDGKDIGYWTAPGGIEHCKAYVYITAMSTLQLEVYYRYLPTYQKPEDIAADAKADQAADGKDKTIAAKDLDIQITPAPAAQR